MTSPAIAPKTTFLNLLRVCGPGTRHAAWLGRCLRAAARGSGHARTRRRPPSPTTLLTNPRIGERLEEFEPRDVRRILVGHYEMRYEIADSTIYLLRLWHTREDR